MKSEITIKVFKNTVCVFPYGSEEITSYTWLDLREILCWNDLFK